jgi:hypothetical protein
MATHLHGVFEASARCDASGLDSLEEHTGAFGKGAGLRALAARRCERGYLDGYVRGCRPTGRRAEPAGALHEEGVRGGRTAAAQAPERAPMDGVFGGSGSGHLKRIEERVATRHVDERTYSEFNGLRGPADLPGSKLQAQECGKESNRKGARGARDQRRDISCLPLAPLASLRLLFPSVDFLVPPT